MRRSSVERKTKDDIPREQGSRVALLEAAKSVLRERGYSALTTREVAAAAGAPLSQIHYYFGSKRGLIVALYKYLDEQLLDRQQRMFGDPGLALSKQWEMACDFLDEDLASGYVRVLQELWAAGWSDPEMAKVVLEVDSGWVRLLADVARKAEARFGSLGPFTPEEIAALVAYAFIGAETFVLLGFEELGVPVRQSLRRVGDIIRMLEEREKSVGGDHAGETAKRRGVR